MARQYLGCPATSASVERLFSQVGIAFANKRKSADAATLEDIIFSRINLPRM
jgi:predicted nucleic acid-binding Zn ribbon protein